MELFIMKELLKKQIAPLLYFGLPAWCLAFLSFYISSRELTYFVIVVLFIYFILSGINMSKYISLREKKYPEKWGDAGRLKVGFAGPNYVKEDDELNKLFAIHLRWLVIFLGIGLAPFIAFFLR